jgi:hypothetical protein
MKSSGELYNVVENASAVYIKRVKFNEKVLTTINDFNANINAITQIKTYDNLYHFPTLDSKFYFLIGYKENKVYFYIKPGNQTNPGISYNMSIIILKLDT